MFYSNDRSKQAICQQQFYFYMPRIKHKFKWPIQGGHGARAMVRKYRACKSRSETMRDFRLPEPFDYRSDILTLKSLSRKSSLCLRTP